MNLDAILENADWTKTTPDFPGWEQWAADNPNMPAAYLPEQVVGAGWDESEHPRHPEGTEQGGQFAPKQLGSDDQATDYDTLGSDRDPGWEGDPIAPSEVTFGGETYSAVDHSDRVWAGEQIPHMNYSLRPIMFSRDDYGPEYREQVAEEFARIGEEGDLRLTTPAYDVLEDIVRTGEFKTQFETGTSGGVFSPDIRAAQEKMFFGYPEDIPPHQRPVYGWLDHVDRERRYNEFAQYGNATWHIKPEVKARTTMTSVDSLSRPVVPGPVRNPGWRATVPPGYTDGGMPSYVDDHLTGNGFFDDVIETQYHGGLSLQDVEQLDLQVFGGFGAREQYASEWEALRELQEEYDIPVVFVDEDGETISTFPDEDNS